MSESIEQLALRTAQQGDWRIANWLEFEAHRAAAKGADMVPVAGLLEPRGPFSHNNPNGRLRYIEFRDGSGCDTCDGSGICAHCGDGDCPDCDGMPGEEHIEYRDLGGGIVSLKSLPPYSVGPLGLRKAYDEALAEHQEAAA